MTYITVNNSAELESALRTATGGETIVLVNNGEDYDLLDDNGNAFYNIANPTSLVTITSADPANPVNFSAIKLNLVSNIQFEDITVGTVGSSGWAYLQDAENVTFSNVQFYGGAYGELGVTDGYITGTNGLKIVGGGIGKCYCGRQYV